MLTVLYFDVKRSAFVMGQAEVERFLFMLISGECKNLRHLVSASVILHNSL